MKGKDFLTQGKALLIALPDHALKRVPNIVQNTVAQKLLIIQK